MNAIVPIRGLIQGAGGGGGKGGGGGAQRTPVEEANTLRSKATTKVVDLISEGEVWGLKDGLKSIYYDETPLQNANGSYNFKNIIVDARPGTPGQTYIDGFAAEVGLTIGAGSNQFTASQAWERQINDPNLDAVRVTVRIPVLTSQDTTTGDLRGSVVDVKIEVRTSTGSYVTAVDQAIAGKCIAVYERSYRINLPKPATSWYIRVSRTIGDSTSTERRDTYVGNVAGLIDSKFSYPNSALIAHQFDAAVFGGAVPRRSYRVLGIRVPLPNVYNPFTRLYSNSVWGGTFAGPEWTNNPAWIYYDLLTNKRYGLGEYISSSQIAIYELFEIAKYCDAYNARPWNANNDYGPNGKHGVPDGKGGFEPRFTFNGVINTRREAYQVLQSLAGAFRGMTYWGTGTVVPVQDRPGDVIHTVNQTNVKDGIFNYQSSGLKDRATICQVTFNDPDDFFRPAVETVEHPTALLTYGPRVREITAFGCTSRSEAHRLGKWSLDTDWNENELVNYSTGLDHILARPGQIAAIADPVTTGDRLGVRLADYDSGCISPIGTNAILEPTFERDALTTMASPGVVLSDVQGTWQCFSGIVATPKTVQISSRRWRSALVCYDQYTMLGKLTDDTGRSTNLFTNPRAEGTGPAITGGNLPVGWAVAGVPSGMTATLVTRTTYNGIPVVRLRLSGTPSATGFIQVAFDNSTLGIVGVGDNLCGSVYAAVFSGTKTNISNERLQLVTRDSGGSSITVVTTNISGGVGTGTVDTQRYYASITGAGAGSSQVNFRFQVGITATGVATDITYDIGFPQIDWGKTTPGYLVLPPVGSPRISSTQGTGSGFNVVPGEVLYGACWADTQAASGAASAFALAFYNHRNVQISAPALAWLTAGSIWSYYSGSLTVPALAVRAVPYVFRDITGGTGTVNGPNTKLTSLYVGRSSPYIHNGVYRTLKLDKEVTLGGADEIMVPKRVGGGVYTASISYVASPQKYLYLSSALPEEPLTGTPMIVSSGNARPRKFRIFQVRESGPTEFDVVATEHDETKYLRVEFDYQLPRPVTTRLSTGAINAPTGFVWQESLYRLNNAVLTRLTFSWNPCKDQNNSNDVRVAHYNVDIKRPSGIWERVASTTQTTYEIPDAETGVWQVRISGQTLFGVSDALDSGPFTVIGKTAPPADVSNFTLTSSLDGVLLTWTDVTDIDLVGYEIREGTSWDSGTIIVSGLKATSFFVPLSDTDIRQFFIRAKDDSGNYSQNPASVIGRVSAPQNVENMEATPQGETVVLSWTPVPGSTVEYEVRVGDIWDFGLVLGRVAGNSFVAYYPGAGVYTFWVKAVSKLGLYSPTPTFAQALLNNPAFRNIVVSTDYQAASFSSGQKTNLAYESATNSLAVQLNILSNPTAYNNAAWTKSNVTVTADATTNYLGATTAELVVENTATNVHAMSQTFKTVKGYLYQVSVEVKPTGSGSARYFGIVLPNTGFGSNVVAGINLSTGAVTSSGSPVAAFADSLGGGWYRLTVIAEAKSSTLTGVTVSLRLSTSSAITGSYTGDGVSGAYVGGSSITVQNVNAYGEYFVDVALAAEITARNWLDSDFGLLDSNNLTWQTANFTWASSEAAKVSWISTGEEVGAWADRVIARKITTTLPTELLFGAECNGATTDLRGASVVSNVGTSYAAHAIHQGVSFSGSAGTPELLWSPSLPSTFALRCTFKANPGMNPDYITIRHTTGRYIDIKRHADGTYEALFADGYNITISDFPLQFEDIITVSLVQTSAARILALYSHRQKRYRVEELRTTSSLPQGVFDRVGFRSMDGASGAVFGNLEVWSTPYEGEALSQFTKEGITPPGYSAFQTLLPGDYTYKDAIIGVMMFAPPGTGRPAITAMKHVVDVVDVVEQRAVSVSAGWTSYTFNKTFTVAPMVVLYQRGGAGSTAMGETQNITKTGFEGRLVNSAGTAVAGNGAFIAAGY